MSTLLALLATAAAPEGRTLRVPADFPTIQAAIDASAPGDTVRVEPGTYRERIRLRPGVTVRSAGDDAAGKLGLARAEATILDGGGEGDGPGVAMAEGSTLDGFTVTHVGRYDEAEWNRHHATQGNEQQHGDIGRFGKPGVGIEGVTCTVTNSIVHHNGDTGIAVRGAEGRRCAPTILRNVCFRNMGGGIGVMNGATGLIEGNVCTENFYAGIGHDNASPVVTGNTCTGNIRAGIGISEGASPVVRVNRLSKNRRAGIGIRTGVGTRPVVEENECVENDMAGIACEEESAPVIRNNRCRGNAAAGIGARSGARPIIVGNECRGNGAAGIGVRDGAVAVVVGNLCVDNGAVPIGVAGGARAIQEDNRTAEEKAPSRP